MASVTKRCRVCGKEYEACRSANRAAGVFRWQEVACSPECGAIYLQKINESRGVGVVLKRDKRKKTSESQVVSVMDSTDVSAAEERASEAPAESKEEV